MPGLYFEEFTVGQTIEHPIRRTITEADNVWFSALTHNPAPLHIDAEYCKGTEFGQPLVNSCLTLAFILQPSNQVTGHFFGWITGCQILRHHGNIILFKIWIVRQPSRFSNIFGCDQIHQGNELGF